MALRETDILSDRYVHKIERRLRGGWSMGAEQRERDVLKTRCRTGSVAP